MSDVRGGRFYDQAQVGLAYANHREWPLNPNRVMEEPAFLSVVGDVAGNRVLDAGCGDGGCAADLLDAGAASVVAVDGSAAMIARARASLAGRKAEVKLADLEDYQPPARSFDLVICRLALHYVADPAHVIRGWHRALAPGGRLVMTVVHPVLTAARCVTDGQHPRTDWRVDDYFLDGPRRRRWLGGEVTWYHRTVEQWLQTLMSAGFVLTHLSECEPDRQRLAGHDAELTRRQRVPLFLLLAAQAGERNDRTQTALTG